MSLLLNSKSEKKHGGKDLKYSLENNGNFESTTYT